MAAAAAAPGGMVPPLGCAAKFTFFGPVPISGVEKRRSKSCSLVTEKSESISQFDGVTYDPKYMDGLAIRVDMLGGDRGRRLLPEVLDAEDTPNLAETPLTKQAAKRGIENVLNQARTDGEMLERLGFQSKATFFDPMPISMFAERKCRSCSPVMQKARVAVRGGHVHGVTCDPKYMLGLAIRVDMLRGERGRHVPSQSPDAERELEDMHGNPLTKSTSAGGNRNIPDQATYRHRRHRAYQAAPQVEDKITLMIRHIPYTITYERLKQAVDDLGFEGLYHRVWIPPSPLAQLGRQRFTNRGYGFIKFVNNMQAAANFMSAFEGYHFENCQRQRYCEVVLAHVQD